MVKEQDSLSYIHATSLRPNNLLFFRLSYLFLFTNTVSKGNVNNQDRRKRCLFNVVSQWLVYSKTQPISWGRSFAEALDLNHLCVQLVAVMQAGIKQWWWRRARRSKRGWEGVFVCVWWARGREIEKRETYWIAEAALTRLNSLWSIKGLCINSKTTPDSY